MRRKQKEKYLDYIKSQLTEKETRRSKVFVRKWNKFLNSIASKDTLKWYPIAIRDRPKSSNGLSAMYKRLARHNLLARSAMPCQSNIDAVKGKFCFDCYKTYRKSGVSPCVGGHALSVESNLSQTSVSIKFNCKVVYFHIQCIAGRYQNLEYMYNLHK